jgi:hypothetical protein
MRASFPLTVAVSLAVHVLIGGGIALWDGLGAPANDGRHANEFTTLTLVPPNFVPVRPSDVPGSAKPAPARVITVNRRNSPPLVGPARQAAAMLSIANEGLPVLTKPARRPEAETGAQSRHVVMDAVLNPSPAPHLDGTHGAVFILDLSRSMYEPYAGSTRVALARQAISNRVRGLPDGTPFAIVLYAERAWPSGPLVAANDGTRAAAVRFLMRDVAGGGASNLPAGLAAARTLNAGALVLATDGDLEISAPDLMLESREILGGLGRGPSLEVIGIAPRIGTGADHLLQDLADEQGGTYEAEPQAEETALAR